MENFWLAALFLIFLFLLALVYMLIRFNDPLADTTKALTVILLAMLGSSSVIPSAVGPASLNITLDGILQFSSNQLMLEIRGNPTQPSAIEVISVVFLLALCVWLSHLQRKPLPETD